LSSSEFSPSESALARFFEAAAFGFAAALGFAVVALAFAAGFFATAFAFCG
jgi:hypothetical protein